MNINYFKTKNRWGFSAYGWEVIENEKVIASGVCKHKSTAKIEAGKAIESAKELDLSSLSDEKLVKLSILGDMRAFLEGRKRGISRKDLNFPQAKQS